MRASTMVLAALAGGGLGCSSSTPPATAGPAPAAAPGRAASTPVASRAPASRRGSVVYQPMARTTYVIRRQDSVTVQLPNGLPQTQELTRTVYLAVASAAGSPMRVSITLDSVLVGGVGISQAAADSARGTQWTGTLSPEGRLSGLTADRVTAVGQQLSGMLPTFFPTLPGGGARDGAQWTDTLTDTLRAMAFNVRETAVVSSRAAADNGVRIESTVAFTRTGGGSQFGQAVEVQATGTRQLTSRLRPDGVLTETTGTESSNMTLTIPAVGQSLPVRQSASFTVTLAPTGR